MIYIGFVLTGSGTSHINQIRLQGSCAHRTFKSHQICYSGLYTNSKYDYWKLSIPAYRILYLSYKFNRDNWVLATWNSCSSYFTIRNLLLLHSIIYMKELAYLYNKLSFLKSKRTCNIRIPKHNFLSTSRQFFVSAVKHWNSLPNHL